MSFNLFSVRVPYFNNCNEAACYTEFDIKYSHNIALANAVIYFTVVFFSNPNI